MGGDLMEEIVGHGWLSSQSDVRTVSAMKAGGGCLNMHHTWQIAGHDDDVVLLRFTQLGVSGDRWTVINELTIPHTC